MSVPNASPFGLLPGEFAIRTLLKNTYFTARDGGRHSVDAVITSATTPGPNEKFTLTSIEPNWISIQTQDGYYVSAEGGGGRGGAFDASQTLQTERTALADDALWRLPGSGGIAGLKTFDGNFLTALGGGGKTTGAFHSDATVENTWENFWVLKSGDLGSGFRYFIRPTGTEPGNPECLSVVGLPGADMTFFHGMSSESVFTLIRLDDGSYALQLPTGFSYVTALDGGGLANGDNLRTYATEIQAWEKFRFVDQGDASYAIQTSSGFFLGVNTSLLDGYGAISTRINDPDLAPSIGYTAKFELGMVIP